MKEYYIPFNKTGGVIVDYDFTNPIHCMNWHKNGKGYIQSATNTGGKIIQIHRMLFGFPIKIIDHINRNKSDNRINNLRISTTRKNSLNKNSNRRLFGAFKNGKNKTNLWKSQIYINKKIIHIGVFKTEIEAHIAYTLYNRGL